jgi:ankyrin repeat protein
LAEAGANVNAADKWGQTPVFLAAWKGKTECLQYLMTSGKLNIPSDLDVADANHLEIKYDKTKPNGQIRRDIDVTRFKKIIPDYNFISLRDGIKDCFNTIKN